MLIHLQKQVLRRWRNIVNLALKGGGGTYRYLSMTDLEKLSLTSGIMKLHHEANDLGIPRAHITQPLNNRQLPFFTMGLCWREQASATPVQAWDQGPIMAPNPMTPLLLTGSTLRTLTERGGAQKPDEYFLMQPSETIGIVNRQTSQRINNLAEVRHARVALSSPAMEVGVDLDNLTEAILFKAIRNIASYRQKIGRLGRERYRDTYAATLASFRAIDFHYYRNPTPLLSNNNLEPIPLATQNLDLKRQLAFHAIMDWFSRQHTMVRVLDSPNAMMRWQMVLKFLKGAGTTYAIT